MKGELTPGLVLCLNLTASDSPLVYAPMAPPPPATEAWGRVEPGRVRVGLATPVCPAVSPTGFSLGRSPRSHHPFTTSAALFGQGGAPGTFSTLHQPQLPQHMASQAPLLAHWVECLWGSLLLSGWPCLPTAAYSGPSGSFQGGSHRAREGSSVVTSISSW